MCVYCVVHINHNRQHRSCPYVPPTKCASVRKRKFVPSKSECVPLLHDNFHFLFTVSYFPYDATFSEYSSRLSMKLLSRSHRLPPLSVSFLCYTYIASVIIRRATLIYKYLSTKRITRNILICVLVLCIQTCVTNLDWMLYGGVKRFSANFIFIHTTINLPYLA